MFTWLISKLHPEVKIDEEERLRKLRLSRPILTVYCDKHGLSLGPDGSTLYDLLEKMIQDLESHSQILRKK